MKLAKVVLFQVENGTDERSATSLSGLSYKGTIFVDIVFAP